MRGVHEPQQRTYKDCVVKAETHAVFPKHVPATFPRPCGSLLYVAGGFDVWGAVAEMSGCNTKCLNPSKRAEKRERQRRCVQQCACVRVCVCLPAWRAPTIESPVNKCRWSRAGKRSDGSQRPRQRQCDAAHRRQHGSTRRLCILGTCM